MSNFDPSIPAGVPAHEVASVTLLRNGSAYAVAAGNRSEILMESSSISASTAISVTNFCGKGFYAYLNITSAFPGSGSTTLALKIKITPPNATASAITVAACAAVSASGMSVLCMYPGLTSAASASAGAAAVRTAGFPAPKEFQVVASYSSAAASAALTCSIGLHVIN